MVAGTTKTNASPEPITGDTCSILWKSCFKIYFKRLRVGHMMKFGGSTRLVILQGPSEVFDNTMLQEEKNDQTSTFRTKRMKVS